MPKNQKTIGKKSKEPKKKDYLPDTEISEKDVLQIVRKEYKESEDFVKEKRQIFRDRLKLYNNQRKQRDKIGITTLYNTMNTLLAVYYTDELSVSFGGKGFSGIEIAENIELLAKSDNDDMEMDIISYLTQWDRFFFGVGIRAVHGFDDDKQCPIVESFDPFTWLPDPQGSMIGKQFRFMGFDVEIADTDMTEERGFFNFKNLPQTNKNTEQDQTEQAYKEAQGLDVTTHVRESVPDNYSGNIHYCVNWYTMIDDQKYLITCTNDFGRVIRFEHIKPVYLKERKNETLTPWGIALNYYSPTRHDPFGTSVADLVEDKQRAKSVLANLYISLIKSKLYPMYLYNGDMVLNRRDLEFGFNKFIKVMGDPNKAVTTMQKESGQTGEVANSTQMLDRETNIATGADSMQSGILSSQNRTLGEIEQVQANANIRFALGSKINAIGEKEFWKLWYRCYVQFFGKAEEKIIETTTAFGSQSLTLYGKQFITERSPKVFVKSRVETLQQREKDRVAFAAIAPIVLQDPTRPLVSRRYTERHLLKLHGLTKEQVTMMIPPTPDEMTAHKENELLGRDKMVKLSIQEDHLSHIAIHMTAPDSDAKRSHIQAHQLAYIQSGQQERDRALRDSMVGQNKNLANQAQNTISAQNASQGNKQLQVNPAVNTPAV